MVELKKFFPLVLVLTGIINVLVIKWSDKTISTGSDGKERIFEHPFLQTGIMFFGQILCFIIYKISWIILLRRGDGSENENLITASTGDRGFKPTIFIIPSICDLIGSSMLFFGIYLTHASSWQMLRGASLIFVALFNVNYLNHTLKTHNWCGMLTISLGLLIVVMSDIHYSTTNPDYKAVLTGDLLIIFSQIFQSLQMVYEEKFIKTFDIPALQAIGWQGIFGFCQMLCLYIPLYYIKVDAPFDNNAKGVAEDIIDAFYQMKNNINLIIAHLIFIFSVAIYNYSAISVMKLSSTTGRVLIDSTRVIFIWLFALGMEWEEFNGITILGFIFLLCGVFIYKNVVFVPAYRWILGKLARRRYGDLEADDQQVTSTAAAAES